MTQVNLVNPLDKTSCVVAAIAIAAMGAMFYNILPIFMGAAQDSRGLSDQQIGLIGSSFFAGYNVAIISAFWWIRRVNWRHLGYVAVPVTAIAFLLGSLSESYAALMTAVFLAGAGSSILYGLATIIIGDTSHPTRWFGIKTALEGSLGAVLLFALPAFIVIQYGLDGLLVALAAMTLCATPFLVFLPSEGSKDDVRQVDAGTEAPQEISNVGVWIAVIATALFFTGESAAWSFLERIGNEVGIAASTVGVVLGVTLVFAALGSFAAAAWGEKIQFIWTISISCFLFFVSMLMLQQSEIFLLYVVGACLFSFSFGFGIALNVSFVASLDVTGRFVVLTVPAIGIGAMIGPGLAGWLTTHHGYGGLISAACLLVGTSLALVFVANAMSNKQT